MGYLNLVGSFIYREPLFRSKLDALAENDAQLKTDGWAQNTKLVFYQAAVPTGWTQDTSNNDKALRVVGSIGGGGSGGSKALSSTISLAHVNTPVTASDGSHTHTYSDHTHQLSSSSTNLRGSTTWVFSNGGYLYLADSTGGSSSISQLKGPWKSPGALTLSTQAAHTHGTPGSSLTDTVFAYADVIIGTKNAPGGTYTDLTSYWSTGTKIDFDPFQESANNDAYNLGNLMPAGSVSLFGQPSAPSGWTKIAGIDDRMLRVVSGAGGGTGGSQPISSGVNLAHSHSYGTVSDHTHTFPDHQHTLDTGSSSTTAVLASSTYGYIQASGGILFACKQTVGLPTSSQTVYKPQTVYSGSGGSTSAAGGHTHDISSALTTFTLAYVDVIQCSKDSSGSPYSYTDYTAEFAWKKLVSYQRLNTLAKNDEYIHYHTTPSGSTAFFFMASPPSGWVKITSQHDKALRVVSGSTGGSPGGGSQLLSATISLAHTHPVVAQADHTHVTNHTHSVDSGTQTVVTTGSTIVDHTAISEAVAGTPQPGGRPVATTTPTPDSEPAAAGGHNHGGVTDSQLSDIALAYADVIWCTKS